MSHVDDVRAWAEERFAGQDERLSAIRSVLSSIGAEAERDPEHRRLRVLERLITPEQTIRFRVVWEDDAGEVHVNEGWRVLQSTQLGPGKGGLRFHRSVNESIVSFLAFEQQFKNALTGLALGAAKGGADFDAHDRSDREMMRFCQAFMTELHAHIGARTDVPAGDIGVGTREIGYLFGQYRRIVGTWDGVLTGKGDTWGGSLLRQEATGYGLVYFLGHMLEARDRTLEGERIAVSGAGNVALHAAEKLIADGAKVVTLSNSRGVLMAEDGFTADTLEKARGCRYRSGTTLADLDGSHGLRWVADGKAWEAECSIALPCATQGELDEADARGLVERGCRFVAEGANMPCTEEAIGVFREEGVYFGPGKAANAGGVSVSGLEMAQNAKMLRWARERVDERLREIMQDIFRRARVAAEEAGAPDDLLRGADIAGYRRLADALVAQGLG
ncbi:MAG: NADP-specific glutamate dehydrogenase [Deltaproteobacteria bacterium]|nr:MAG: NADP-specific glutamate dehydrogenase [Deltaproteobacteria bacterium]